MDVPLPPGGFGEDFLAWLREASERGWQRINDPDIRATRLFWPRWRRGTRWTGGLTVATIMEIEHRYDVHFPAQHRLFLQALHSTTPWRYGPDYSRDRTRPVLRERPGFYNRLRDDEHIRTATRHVIDGLLSETLDQQYWHHSWGPCPHPLEERRARMTELVAAAPPLIPIFGHRFLIDHGPRPVLSIMGTDVVVYGDDLRDYLLHELRDVLDMVGVQYAAPVGDAPHIPFWNHIINLD